MKSIWNEDVSIKRSRRTLPKHTDAAVIGGGMAGILCGWFLQEAGLKVVILEAEEIGSGQTGKTTAKITSQHGLIYSKLTETLGEEAAGIYGHASQKAIDEYERIAVKTGIQCEFQRLPSYLYTNTDAGVLKLEKERTAAVKAGIPASIVYKTALPFPVKAALKFENQAQFHPLKFLYGLAKELNICENTKVLKVRGHMVVTSHGTMETGKVIFATHFPFPNWPGFYFARMHQERSYVMALKAATAGKESLNGIYYGIDSGGLSLRNADDLILLGGMGHRTGDCPVDNPYDALKKQADALWGRCAIERKWSAQDCMTLDSVPYIGRFSRLRPDWYVATGFGKWGMTNSMVSAMIIRDLVTGRQNPDWEVFSPQRFTWKASCKNFLTNMGHTMKNFFVPGGPRCPHLGCRLKWNRTEKTWECPCHGSRFGKEGNLLDNPSKKGIKKPGPQDRL